MSLYIYVHTCRHIHASTSIYTYTCICSYIHTHIYIYIDMYIYICTYMYTNTCSVFWVLRVGSVCWICEGFDSKRARNSWDCCAVNFSNPGPNHCDLCIWSGLLIRLASLPETAVLPLEEERSYGRGLNNYQSFGPVFPIQSYSITCLRYASNCTGNSL